MSIKVFIQTKVFEGGPAIFRSRIIPLLNEDKDIEVVTNINKPFDIELAFIRKVFKHNKPYILRADGCYYEQSRKQSNKSIKEAFDNAKHIIFQSKFSFDLCKKVLNFNSQKDYSIIHNGIDLDYIKSIEPSRDVELGSFVSCAGWRPNKRPNSTIKGFLKADINRHLYLIGDSGFVGEKINKKYNSKYIHVLGKLSNKKTISIMKACEYQLHLCHIDSCPNAVIEGLSCGLKILHTNLGGTRELVKDNGVMLTVDKMWSGRYLKETNLDNLNKKTVAEAIFQLLKLKKEGINRLNFDINVVAQEYLKIIKKVLKK